MWLSSEAASAVHLSQTNQPSKESNSIMHKIFFSFIRRLELLFVSFKMQKN